ncbi:molybdopterin molybdotransferase MoeA [Egicoccus halophilus]|uniref:Molybdopterin molybdenumtransferase n=1 Tax=Egicoccus halophilus TaxID=1670830 RepID=A0A8J3A7R1_9ACTN|nr:gephyrin-like molybdotransferase Glp [Egicoccus halophilus]GGI03643.1 molybdopterin molybdenumtransferase MoeA [Egicoccus halophilus]
MTRFVGHGRTEVTAAEELTPVDEHLQAILDALPTPDAIGLTVFDALGLVLAEDVVGQAMLPAFANAAMDGYAVVAADIAGASLDQPVELPVIGEVAAGAGAPAGVPPGKSVRIMTGAPVPAGTDAVVPVETTSGGAATAAFHRPVAAGDHIRRPGEDLQPGQVLLRSGRRVQPADVGLLTAAGVARVLCVPPPRVVVLSSGDELVPANREPGPGQIRDSNGPMLAAMVRAAGGIPFTTGVVPDDRKALMYAFDTNLGHADLFVCTGGASAGTRDLLPDVIGAMGEVATAKVAMKPGMPQIRGRIGGTPVIGLPGNPVSAFVSFEVFVRPAIRLLQGRRDVTRPVVTARVAEPLVGASRKRHYVRVRLTRTGSGWSATPTGAQGSHVISSISSADGLAVVPEDRDRLEVGESVPVQLLIEG